MFYALKKNRQIKIDDSEKEVFEARGFEVFELKDDKLVSLAKKADPKADAKQIKALEKEVAELKAQLAKKEADPKADAKKSA